jgi:hypothetical protein
MSLTLGRGGVHVEVPIGAPAAGPDINGTLRWELTPGSGLGELAPTGVDIGLTVPGRVEERQTDPRHGPDVGPVLIHGGELFDRGPAALNEHDVRLGDVPRNGVGVHLIRDQNRQTGNRDAVFHELKQRLVATALDLELTQVLGSVGGHDPRGQIGTVGHSRETSRYKRVQVGQT